MIPGSRVVVLVVIAGLRMRDGHSLFAGHWVEQPAQATLEDGFAWSIDVDDHVDAGRNLLLRARKAIRTSVKYQVCFWRHRWYTNQTASGSVSNVSSGHVYG